ncbi:MAG: ATP-binding protein [Acidimicrobiia bacterium]|nr:ATP-binding protein [Acidimicrobiia bacterium]
MTDLLRIDDTPISDRDRTAFETAPIAMWQEDFSGVAQLCDELRDRGVHDLYSRLLADRDLLLDAIGRIVVVDVNEAVLRLVGADSKEDLIGPLPAELINDESHPSFIEQIMAVWEGRAIHELELTGAQFSGTRMDCTLHWAASLVDGVPDYSRVVVVIRDVTDKVQAERQIHEQAEQLEVLLEVGRQISSSLDLGTILQRIVDAAVELIGADESLILLLDRETHSLNQAVSHSHSSDEGATRTCREVLDGISSWVVEHGRAAISQDIATDERARRGDAPGVQCVPGTSVGVAPIVADGVVIGTLTALNNSSSKPVTEADLSMIMTLAAQAAVAIQNARLYEDIRVAHTELQETQAQLLQAQKLESIGSLAAGIAHEINTPIQYVADNTRFLIEAATANGSVQTAVDQLVAAVESGGDTAAALRSLEAVKEEADFEFLVEEIPMALQQTLEGVDRVADIVRAMKEFAHPGSKSMVSVDLNRSLRTTAKVSRSEWKYVADIEFDLDESLPLVPALAGPLNQVFLIMIVNAAQAIEGATSETGNGSEPEKGRIDIVSRRDGDWVEIRISDTGPGVPAGILDRIYDPFFTTKDVGKGSGQGLSIARSVIVEQHRGELGYDDAGPGATFVIRLPLSEEVVP